MRKIVLIFVFAISLFAQTLHIDNFTTDIFSNSQKSLQKIRLSLVVEGRYVEDESYKVIDALNVVIGSFYVETLATSKGKEDLKKLLINYSAKKHSVDIDEIYITDFEIVKQSASTDEIVEALKKEGCCKK